MNTFGKCDKMQNPELCFYIHANSEEVFRNIADHQIADLVDQQLNDIVGDGLDPRAVTIMNDYLLTAKRVADVRRERHGRNSHALRKAYGKGAYDMGDDYEVAMVAQFDGMNTLLEQLSTQIVDQYRQAASNLRYTVPRNIREQQLHGVYQTFMEEARRIANNTARNFQPTINQFMLTGQQPASTNAATGCWALIAKKQAKYPSRK